MGLLLTRGTAEGAPRQRAYRHRILQNPPRLDCPMGVTTPNDRGPGRLGGRFGNMPDRALTPDHPPWASERLLGMACCMAVPPPTCWPPGCSGLAGVARSPWLASCPIAFTALART